MRVESAGSRADFPLLAGSDIIYLDSAASAQKPAVVINTLKNFLETSYANIHRGVYGLSQRSTELYEEGRAKVQEFLNAPHVEEVIFTKGATEAINLVAYSWGDRFLKAGDEIVVTLLEHHANFVPWQLLAQRKGAVVRYVGLGPDEKLSLEAFRAALNAKTKLVAVTQLSNGLGISPPLELIIREAHAVGAKVLVDSAQAISHMKVDVQALEADFVVFSGHKLYGPTGIGVLWGKRSLLHEMPPFQSGGDMIRSVSTKGTTFAPIPARFEAGTPPIAEVVALSAAIDYFQALGVDAIAAHEAELVRRLEARLAEIPQVRILGPVGEHIGLVCFTLADVHPHDLAQFLDQEKIAVRAGHHCAQPLLQELKVSASARISFGVYNTIEEADFAAEAVLKAIKFFGG